jgi:hypothetical protein
MEESGRAGVKKVDFLWVEKDGAGLDFSTSHY